MQPSQNAQPRLNAFETSKLVRGLASGRQKGRALSILEVFIATSNNEGNMKVDERLLFQAARILFDFAWSSQNPAAKAAKFERAKQYLIRALHLSPQDSFCLQLLGDIEMATGLPDDAYDHYVAALKTDRKPEMVIQKIINALLAQGKDTDVEQWKSQYRDLLTPSSRHADVNKNGIRVLDKMPDWLAEETPAKPHIK